MLERLKIGSIWLYPEYVIYRLDNRGYDFEWNDLFQENYMPLNTKLEGLLHGLET